MGMQVRVISFVMRRICVEMQKTWQGCQGGGAGNQGGNLSIAVEMTQNSNGNDKFKGWREVKRTENKHVCKNIVSYI